MARIRTALLFCLLVLASLGKAAETQWLGLYLQGSKIGYVRFSSIADTAEKGATSRNENLMVIDSKMLGSSLSMRSETTSWVDAKGRPVRQKTSTSSGGRTQVVDAKFNDKTVELEINNNGVLAKKSLTIPEGAILEDDPTGSILSGERPATGQAKTIHVFDATTTTLIENKVIYRGKSKVVVKGKSVDADLIEIVDPRMTSKVFVSAKGDLIKIEGAMGLEMYPETEAEAKSESSSTTVPDLAFSTAVSTTPPIQNPEKVAYLRLEVTGMDLSRMPSDKHQTVRQEGGKWLVTCNPIQPDPKSATTIAAAKKAQPNWVKPTLYIPSNSPEFIQRAKAIVGKETRVVAAAMKIKDAVYRRMTPNAGIGVIRDASEVWKTQEGVCRDYAILMATLCRAAGIPTRVVSGLVSDSGKFFYHAWVEVWDGKNWLGLDSTRPAAGLTATHLKIAEGHVEEAFTFFLFEGATIKVLEVRHSKPGKAASRQTS